MKYAIVRLGGKQFKVSEGDVFNVERQANPLSIEVLAYSEGETLELGTPVLTDVIVKAEITDEDTVKTRVARYKSKSRYRKVNGHKQPFSVIKVTEIAKSGSTKSTKTKAKKEEESK